MFRKDVEILEVYPVEIGIEPRYSTDQLSYVTASKNVCALHPRHQIGYK